MKPNLKTMTKTELRAYLVAHPNHQEAFYAFVDRFTSDANAETYPVPQFPIEVEAVEALIH